ncbi:FecR domain-containing protein [Candidatus Sulfidibacterium hydrothermale]|uniref:FecR domain-containing protein n=1 Tax=Candidatus Sulfidibacterium hydrothermale TaxID=2875962 RepID=UPI001F0A4515|nr:FecR domain-containing protein [Candidatus Sulfidibacterium hydrothermale]UBM62489.1 FecR domain-containing protein [Candidatus Sulfidibacterium hydrothermale]
MKTASILFSLTLLFLCVGFSVNGQNPEQTVQQAVNSINQKLARVDQLAREKKIHEAFDLLDKVVDEIEKEQKWDTFSKVYQKAKKANPAFQFKINDKLPPQMSVAFWENYKRKCERILKDQEIVIEGLKSAVKLNHYDEVLAYGKQLKTFYDGITGMAENLGTLNYFKLAYDLKGNSDDFIENYKAAEKATLANLEVEAAKTHWNLVIAKTKKNKELFEDFIYHITHNMDVVKNFHALVKQINREKIRVDNHPFESMTMADRRFYWDYGAFQKEVTIACKDFDEYDIACETFKKQFEKIKSEARSDWNKIKKNIINSDDKDNQIKFLKENNNRWNEFCDVVDPLFQKAYYKNCENVAQEDQGKTLSSKDERRLNIENLYLNQTDQGNQITLRFQAVWDGKWMDRAKMTVWIDDRNVLDKVLSFRDPMGKFQTEFVQRVNLPEDLSGEKHTLRLKFTRDPQIINKKITLISPEKIMAFRTKGKANRETQNKESASEENMQQLFAGANASKKVNLVGSETPKHKAGSEYKTKPVRKISITQKTDRFWENAIPENAKREWVKAQDGMKGYAVRFSVNGRTVGFRRYADPAFKTIIREEIMDNFAVKHGPERRFGFNKEKKKLYLSNLTFYRAGKKTGPKVSFWYNGKIEGPFYFINDQPCSKEEYSRKAQNDPNLPPYNIYLDKKWHIAPAEVNMPDPPAILNMPSVAYRNLKIPHDVVKYVKVRTTKEGIRYTENYYRLDNIYQKAGYREWYITGNRAVLVEEYILFGNKELFRRWSHSGKLNMLEFRKRNIMYDFSYPVGFSLINGRTIYRDHDQNICSRDVYMNECKNYPELPRLSLFSLFNKPPLAKPFQVPFAKGTNGDVLSQRLPAGAKIWRIKKFPNGTEMVFYQKHTIVGIQNWYDDEKTKPSYKSLYVSGRCLYTLNWYQNGEIETVYIYGNIEANSRISLRYDENGHLVYKKFYGKTSEKDKANQKKAFEKCHVDIPGLDYYVSHNFDINTSPLPIPLPEKTPLFTAVYKKGFRYEPVTEDNFMPSPSFSENTETDNKTEDSYRQLQLEEFNRLGIQVEKIIEAADKAFDKPYWEDKSTHRTTLQETNPKQESFDILRKAIPIAQSAKYKENEAMLNHLLAMKFSRYSGRVFNNKAKQEFFAEAAKLVEKADQLLPQLKQAKDPAQLSELYCTSAEVWRLMTKKALWGNHPYNKMACDKKVLQQYERAIQVDPSNQKAKKILAQLKAPKKPVPEAVKKFKEIKPELWNEAQNVMVQLNEESIYKKPEKYKEPEKNFLEVAYLTLEYLDGTVSICEAGTNRWEQVKDKRITLFEEDKIRTEEDARGVSATFADDHTFLAIKPGSVVEFHHDQIYITRGSAFIRAIRKGPHFLVITPTLAVGIRGTQFEVKVSPEKTTETYLYEGVVETRNKNSIGYLIPGEKMISKKGTDKLQKTTFHPRERLQTQWSGLEAQKHRHEQIMTAVPVAKRQVSSGTSANSAHTTPAVVYSVSKVSISPSPDSFYHMVLAATEMHYGEYSLVAHCPIHITQNTPVTVKWYYNNSKQPVSVGQYMAIPNVPFFDGILTATDKPLDPGLYKAEFFMNGKLFGKGSIRVKTPQKLTNQEAQQAYVQALKNMQLGLQYLYQGNIAAMKQQAARALPELRKALYNAPELPDVLTVYQTAQTMLALEKADEAMRRSDHVVTRKWLALASAYIEHARQNCQDAQFKISVDRIAKVMDELLKKQL